jgi:hypothetical protein
MRHRIGITMWKGKPGAIKYGRDELHTVSSLSIAFPKICIPIAVICRSYGASRPFWRQAAINISLLTELGSACLDFQCSSVGATSL